MPQNQTTQIITNIVAAVRSRIGEEDYNKWIAPLGIHIRSDNGKDSVVIVSPNKFHGRFIRTQYLSHFALAAQAVGPENKRYGVLVTVANETPNTTKHQATTPDIRYSQTHLIKPGLSLDSFIVGGGNELAASQVSEVAVSGRLERNPLVLFGASGLGKSHLAHGLANQLLHGSRKKVAYIHAEQFGREVYKAMYNKDGLSRDELLSFYQQMDVVILEDIQFLAGKAKTQDMLLHIFNALSDGSKQMLFTCDRHPKTINQIQEQLKTRLQMGLVVAVDTPDLDTRIEILADKAMKMGLSLPVESARFIGQRLKSNVRELEGALASIQVQSAPGQAVSIAEIQTILADTLSYVERNITTETIQKTVAGHYNLKPADLLSSSRSRSIVGPRHIAMALSKELTSKSLPEIGRDFGGKDHTTVMHAVKKVQQMRESDRQIDQDYKTIERKLLT